jgi:serine/threonine protein kinase
VSLA